MIYGIGIDIVEVTRIKKAMKRWSNRFLRRVFTESEIKYCFNKVDPAAPLALRFAAKEAFSKAIGFGFRKGLAFHQIEVIHYPAGQPYLTLHSRARELYEECRIKKSLLSLSDEGPYAIAVVILEA